MVTAHPNCGYRLLSADTATGRDKRMTFQDIQVDFDAFSENCAHSVTSLNTDFFYVTTPGDDALSKEETCRQLTIVAGSAHGNGDWFSAPLSVYISRDVYLQRLFHREQVHK